MDLILLFSFYIIFRKLFLEFYLQVTRQDLCNLLFYRQVTHHYKSFLLLLKRLMEILNQDNHIILDLPLSILFKKSWFFQVMQQLRLIFFCKEYLLQKIYRHLDNQPFLWIFKFDFYFNKIFSIPIFFILQFQDFLIFLYFFRQI